MIKKKLRSFGMFLLSITLLCQVGFAQPDDTRGAGKSDPIAKKILNKVSKKYKSYTAVKGNFVLKIENKDLDINEEQEGSFYLKGDKFKLNNAQQEIVCDNTTIWIYLKEVNEVQISNFEPDENSITPAQLFTIYEKDFIYLYSEEVTENGKVLQIIELTPFDKSKPYFKIKLFIEKATSNIAKAKVFDKNGNRYTYFVSNFTPNPNLPDLFFTFDQKAYAGVEVIDLR